MAATRSSSEAVAPNTARNCGSCTACCTVKAIAAQQFIKAPGVTCAHCVKDGCGTYATRPDVCRDYYCAYIATGWLPDRARPDRSGVMLDLDSEADSTGYEGAVTVHVFREMQKVLASPWPETLGALMDSGVAVWLSRPGPPGSLNALFLLNPGLKAAAAARDLEALREGLAAACARLDAHPFAPFSVTEARARLNES